MSGAVPSRLRSRLEARELLVGSFVNRGLPLTAAIMAIGGLDRLVIDLEHGAGGQEEILAPDRDTRSALEQVSGIAAVDGIDVLFVGPTDGAHAPGTEGGVEIPELKARIGEVALAAEAPGKSAGIVVRTVEQAAIYRELGFTFLGCSSASRLLALEVRRVAERLRLFSRGPEPEPTKEISSI